MKSFVNCMCLVVAAAMITIGCSKPPDPRANPDFNEKAMEDPGAVKMGPNAPAVPPTEE